MNQEMPGIDSNQSSSKCGEDGEESNESYS